MSDDSRFGKNVITLWVDNKSSVHANNRKKDVLILGKGPTQRSNDATLTAEAEYSISFSE